MKIRGLQSGVEIMSVLNFLILLGGSICIFLILDAPKISEPGALSYNVTLAPLFPTAFSTLVGFLLTFFKKSTFAKIFFYLTWVLCGGYIIYMGFIFFVVHLKP